MQRLLRYVDLDPYHRQRSLAATKSYKESDKTNRFLFFFLLTCQLYLELCLGKNLHLEYFQQFVSQRCLFAYVSNFAR